MRKSGILMHITSLPSPYGIGTLGRGAFEFADFLSDAGQSCWQINPLNPTGFGDSPYSPLSAFAGNPLLIDLDLLAAEGLIDEREFDCLSGISGEEKVDYFLQYKRKLPLLKKASSEFYKLKSDSYLLFCQNNAFWLDEYAMFSSLREKNGMIEWTEWSDRISDPYECELQKILQYFFFSQWFALKNYCSSKGISIIGGLPFYMPHDSAEGKSNPSLFLLDENNCPSPVLGLIQGSSSSKGKRLGNMLYNWEKMNSDGYSWWKRRLAHSFSIYDYAVIDDFDSFEVFFAVDPLSPVSDGRWIKAPGIGFFNLLSKEIPKMQIIAGDSLYTRDNAHDMHSELGFPCIKKLLSAFESRDKNYNLPHTYDKNCLLLTGTHDNSTILGWANSHPTSEIEYASEYLRISADEGLVWGIIKSMLASVADTVIIQMQDLLYLDDASRMNNPDIPYGNWRWRAKSKEITPSLATKLRYFTRLFGR